MIRREGGRWIIAAGLTLLAATAGAWAQETAPPPQPVREAPEALAPPVAAVHPALVVVAPAAHAAPPACAPYEDDNGPLLIRDALLQRPGSAMPGWFSAAEIDVFGPSLRNRLVNTVDVAGLFTDVVHVPSAELSWTASPRFEFGYRLPEGAGEFLASYYFVVTRGSSNVSDFDPFGDALLTSNLYVHAFDFDYANSEYSLGPLWDMRWKIGVRMAGVFFDSQVQGPFVEQRTTNFFFGAGPHAGLDLRRRIVGTGVSLFGRVEGAGSIGRLSQAFEETFSIDGVPTVGGAHRVSVIQWVPTVRAQAGLTWTPWCDTPFVLSGGYVFEGWWYLGEAQGSSATLTLNGLFLRAELNY